MKVNNTPKELSSEFINTIVNDGRPSRVVVWVDHFMGCKVCRNPKAEFPAQAKTRSELCLHGRKLLDTWIGED